MTVVVGVRSEISESLEECWPMEEAQRKKIIKRLLLKWHPDKNIGAWRRPLSRDLSCVDALC